MGRMFKFWRSGEDGRARERVSEAWRCVAEYRWWQSRVDQFIVILD